MISTLTQSQGVAYNQNYSSTAIGDLHPPMPIDHIHALPPGTRFEEYRLDAVLGAGGFGITYRAYDANLDTFVAIKEYLPGEFAARTEASTVVPKSNTDAQDYHWGLTRFLDEARTLARFNHSAPEPGAAVLRIQRHGVHGVGVCGRRDPGGPVEP